MNYTLFSWVLIISHLKKKCGVIADGVSSSLQFFGNLVHDTVTWFLLMVPNPILRSCLPGQGAERIQNTIHQNTVPWHLRKWQKEEGHSHILLALLP